MIAFGIDDAEIDHGADFDRDVVARDHVLRRHLVDDDAQVDAHHLLNERIKQNEPRPLGAGEAAERENHAALVFAQDFDRGVEKHQNQNDDDGDGGEKHGVLLTASYPERAAA